MDSSSFDESPPIEKDIFAKKIKKNKIFLLSKFFCPTHQLIPVVAPLPVQVLLRYDSLPV